MLVNLADTITIFLIVIVIRNPAKSKGFQRRRSSALWDPARAALNREETRSVAERVLQSEESNWRLKERRVGKVFCFLTVVEACPDGPFSYPTYNLKMI